LHSRLAGSNRILLGLATFYYCYATHHQNHV
jgi:hypothetical protein